MDRIRINGGTPLQGEIAIGGAKNAALILMAASLLTDETLSLSNVPHLADIATMANLLAEFGVEISMDGGAADGDHGKDDVRALKAAFGSGVDVALGQFDLGPHLLQRPQVQVDRPRTDGAAARQRHPGMSLAGQQRSQNQDRGAHLADQVVGCRGVGDICRLEIEDAALVATVGGTENLLMAASLAKGTTVLANAAREPEVGDLANCLVAMGARIEGIGTDTLTIEGVDRLHGAAHRVLPDRIETGTYAAAAAITGGTLVLKGTRIELIDSVVDILAKAGVETTETEDGVRVCRANGPLHGVDLMTEPFPGFPTDMQAQFMALMAVSDGASMITETIFENRFMHVPELTRMGADINVHGASAIVRGVPKLSGAPVMATDLRASVSLVLAGLAAEGETMVNRVYHLDRGYERLEQKLAACGADIERVGG